MSRGAEVDRAEFEGGTDRLMMNVFDGNCQVRFQESGGEAGAWRLVDRECNGDCWLRSADASAERASLYPGLSGN